MIEFILAHGPTIVRYLTAAGLIVVGAYGGHRFWPRARQLDQVYDEGWDACFAHHTSRARYLRAEGYPTQALPPVSREPETAILIPSAHDQTVILPPLTRPEADERDFSDEDTQTLAVFRDLNAARKPAPVRTEPVREPAEPAREYPPLRAVPAIPDERADTQRAGVWARPAPQPAPPSTWVTELIAEALGHPTVDAYMEAMKDHAGLAA